MTKLVQASRHIRLQYNAKVTLNTFSHTIHQHKSTTRNFSLFELFTTRPTPPIVNGLIESDSSQATATPVRKKLRKARKRKTTVDPTSAEGILLYELEEMTARHGLVSTIIPTDVIQHYMDVNNHEIIDDLRIVEVNSNGQGIGFIHSNHHYAGIIPVVVPFATKDDIVQIKLGRHNEKYAEGHLLQVVKPSETRRDDLIRCKYFGTCSGCQLQMISYEDQLKLKTNTVKNAYKMFGFQPEKLPIAPTTGSPQQYGYRTKLTPHFTSNRKNILIGFERAGLGKGMFSLDSCEIATPILNEALENDRRKLEDIVRKYKKGGTILLRDTSIDGRSSYTSNHREIVTQKINDFKFQFPAGEFFQNNNSILPPLLDTIREHIDTSRHKTLVDTYCGSGFFGISLSNDIQNLIGIEVSKGNLEYAKLNAKLNNIGNSRFILGSSEEIFKDLSDVNPLETIVILDPPRKGSTQEYLSQLSNFRPHLIVYVSCNVFTQARDLEYFLTSTVNGSHYTVKSIGGYDFFPQTRHVESLAILELNETA